MKANHNGQTKVEVKVKGVSNKTKILKWKQITTFRFE